MLDAPPTRRLLWTEVDWEAPDPAVAIVLEFMRAVRRSDPVQLALPSGELTEAEAADRLVTRLQGEPEFARRREHSADIAIHDGPLPADAEVLFTGTSGGAAASRERLHQLRRELAALAAVTPVMDRVEWARQWTPEPGFHHLVVDNASSDETAEVLRERGADVVVQPSRLPRVANWISAMRQFRERTTLPWLKWLFAGDELLPGAADVIEAAAAEHPEARLIVAQYITRFPDGATEHWRLMKETRLVMPDEALERCARKGNWFGSPIAHAFHRDVLDEVEFGSQPWVADWQACVSIARRHPVLYIAEPVGVFDIGSRQFFQKHERDVYSLLQELSLRQQCLDELRTRAPDRDDLGALEQEVDEHAASALTERVRERQGHGRISVVDRRRAGERGAAGGARSEPVIAIHAPRPIDPTGRDYNGYAPEFAARFGRYAYQPQLAGHPEVTARRARGERVVNDIGLELVTDAAELNRVADILVCFEGRPYLPEMAPPKEFTGLKAYHVWEFVFYAPEANQALVEGGVDLALGYCRHDEYSPFFRAFYPSFIGRTVAVPFGFSPRFQSIVPFPVRTQKVVGLGSVNPVDDPLCPPGELDAYVSFHQGERWTHRWRRTLVERAGELADVLDAKFPVFPETKDTSYDAVEVLNAYAMFANDPGLMAFPPARTYEGPACGALLVGEDSAVHRDLGFVHGNNALLHAPHDVEDFARVVREALAEPEHLHEMAVRGQLLVEERYSHEAVARTLHEQLCRVFAGREP